MNQYDYLIVESGLYGATFACLATDVGCKCLVVEKLDHIGSKIYTKEIEEIQTHQYGTHIFHTNDQDIWGFVRRFSDFKQYVHSPIVNYKERIYNLPFNMNTFAQM